MGWTGYYTTESAEEVVRKELTGDSYRPTANRGAKYWVLENTKTGERVAVVALVQRRNGELFTKIVDETMGPYDHGFPLALLAMLTPTEYEYANAWRERVRQHHADKKSKPKLKAGDTVVFATPISFTDGHSHDRLTYIGGFRFRTTRGRTVRLSKSWRTTYDWKIETLETV